MKADNKTSQQNKIEKCQIMPLAYVRNVHVWVMLYHADQGFITAGRRCRVARSKRNGLREVPCHCNGHEGIPLLVVNHFPNNQYDMKSWQKYANISNLVGQLWYVKWCYFFSD